MDTKNIKDVVDGITVAELIGKLLREDMDSIVVFSQDAEGNTYKPLCGDVSAGAFEPHDEKHPWIGDITSGKPDCVILWPIN
jgi:hypothetical protein